MTPHFFKESLNLISKKTRKEKHPCSLLRVVLFLVPLVIEHSHTFFEAIINILEQDLVIFSGCVMSA